MTTVAAVAMAEREYPSTLRLKRPTFKKDLAIAI
jgi:hypothetical protein